MSSLTQMHSSAIIKGDQANIMKPDFRRKTRVTCDHCGKLGHLKRECFDIVGYPPGWQRRQPNRFVNEGNCEKYKERGHLTITTKEPPTTVAAQAVEEFKSKLMSTEEVPEATSRANISQGAEVRKNSWDWN
ncbi:unnamed protein product [Alopecurus aequalis]